MGCKETLEFNHIIVFDNGQMIFDKITTKDDSKPKIEMQLKGEKVQFVGNNRFNHDQFAVCSKNTLLQLWDINTAEKGKPVWMAKNLPNDELDLQIPIWDTGMVFDTEKTMCVSTAEGQIRYYDINDGKRRPVIDTQVTKDSRYIHSIVQSK